MKMHGLSILDFDDMDGAEAQIEVVQLQPAEDCPGLWIGFKTVDDRERAMRMFRVAE